MSNNTKSTTGILYPNASIYFFLALIVTWIGFSHSYFLRITELSVFHHIHGAIAGAWILLLMIQPILYKRGKLALHRKIGRIASFTLFPLLLLGGLKMIHLMLNNANAYPPGVPNRLAYLDFYGVILLLYFFYQAISKAKQLQIHARFMSLTVLVMLPPAIARMLFLIPWFDNFDKALNVSYGIILLITGLLILDDKRKGQIFQPYPIAFALFLIQLISMDFVGRWQWWADLMVKYASL